MKGLICPASSVPHGQNGKGGGGGGIARGTPTLATILQQTKWQTQDVFCIDLVWPESRLTHHCCIDPALSSTYSPASQTTSTDPRSISLPSPKKQHTMASAESSDFTSSSASMSEPSSGSLTPSPLAALLKPDELFSVKGIVALITGGGTGKHPPVISPPPRNHPPFNHHP